MIRLFPIAALLVIAACATPSPERNHSASVQAVGSGGDELVGQNDPSKDTAAIQDIEAPDAPKTPTEQMPHMQPEEPAVVCENVVKTGSILPTKVCHRQSDVERRQESDQRMYEDIKLNTTLGHDGL